MVVNTSNPIPTRTELSVPSTLLGQSISIFGSLSATVASRETEIESSATRIGDATSGPLPPSEFADESKKVSRGAAIAIAVVLGVTLLLLLALFTHQRQRKRRRSLTRGILNRISPSTVLTPNANSVSEEMSHSEVVSPAVASTPHLPNNAPIDRLQGTLSEAQQPFVVQAITPYPAPLPRSVTPSASSLVSSALARPDSAPHASVAQTVASDLQHSNHDVPQLPSQYILPVQPRPYDFSSSPYPIHAQKETHLPGSHLNDN